MSSPDLEKELGELKSELFKLRFSLATNGLDNPMKIREVKKDIAKIKTVLTERELKGEEPVVAEEPKKAEKKTASKAKKEAKEKPSLINAVLFYRIVFESRIKNIKVIPRKKHPFKHTPLMQLIYSSEKALIQQPYHKQILR